MALRPVRRTDWNHEPMPEPFGTVPVHFSYDRRAFERIRLGLFPRQMEDKWFAYYEDPWLHLHRSWSGYLIYRVRFELEGEGARAVEVQVNQDPGQYTSGPLEGEASKAESLVNGLLAFNGVGPAPKLPALPEDPSTAALFMWGEVGRAMLGQGPLPGYDLDQGADDDTPSDPANDGAPEEEEEFGGDAGEES